MSRFTVQPHVIDASHLHSEFPRATTSAYANHPRLKLAVNQYTPRPSAGRPRAADGLTLIFCHANGFHKELYEPFFDHLLADCDGRGVPIRAIWAPDAAHQGASGILNEDVLGHEPSWNDLPRDLLHMVNVFREQMVPPIVGIGHSFGGHAIARTSLMHPSLFTALVLIDPVIGDGVGVRDNPGYHPAKLSARRRDVWRSQAEAEAYFRSRPFYQRWDPRVLDLHLKHGLRPLPTATYPDGEGVTLATTKAQEVYTFLRVDPQFENEAQLGRSESRDTFQALHLLRPPILYVVGGKSDVSTPAANARKMQETPHAEMAVVKEAGHLVCQEEPAEAAALVAPYLGRQLERWRREAEEDARTPRHRHVSEDFMRRLGKL